MEKSKNYINSYCRLYKGHKPEFAAFHLAPSPRLQKQNNRQDQPIAE